MPLLLLLLLLYYIQVAYGRRGSGVERYLLLLFLFFSSVDFSFLRYYSIYNIFTRNGCWLAALISGFLYSGNGAFLFLFYISILHVLF